MTTSRQQGELFNADDYDDPRMGTPELLGVSAGGFLGLTRYVELVLDSDATVFRPVRGEMLTIVDGKAVYEPDPGKVTHTSPGYADDDFPGDFTHWQQGPAYRKIEYPRPRVEGYLVGFPVLEDQDGKKTRTLHYWANDEDVFGDTAAIPLHKVASGILHSSTRTELELALNHLAEGSPSDFAVEVLRNIRTNEPVYVPATMDEIKDAIHKRQMNDSGRGFISTPNENPYTTGDTGVNNLREYFSS